jgi:hypothetical protein
MKKRKKKKITNDKSKAKKKKRPHPPLPSREKGKLTPNEMPFFLLAILSKLALMMLTKSKIRIIVLVFF